MKTKGNHLIRRWLALILCLAMILPVLPQTAWAAGLTEITAGNIIDGTAPVTTKTPLSKYTLVTDSNLYQRGQYLIMSGSSGAGSIMSYNPVSKTTSPNAATSIQIGTGEELKGSYRFTDSTNKSILIDHSDRYLASWIVMQYRDIIGSNTGLSTGSAFSTQWPTSNSTYVPAEGLEHFGGSQTFYGVEMQKGLNGTLTPNDVYAPFWNATGTSSKEFRFLDTRVDLKITTENAPFHSLSAQGKLADYTTGGDRYKYCVELFPDGTCLIYNRRWTEADKWTYSFLCYNNGKWMVKKISTTTEKLTNTSEDHLKLHINNNFQSLNAQFGLKLRLYKLDTGSQTVAFSGAQTYTVPMGKTVADLTSAIVENLSVYRADLPDQKLSIPYSSSKTMNTYWLDTSKVNMGQIGKYPVTLHYVNDDGSLTLIGTVSVLIASDRNLGTGYISKNASINMKVFAGTAADSLPLTFSTGGETVELTVNMLSQDGININTGVPGSYEDVVVLYNDIPVGTITLVIAEGTIAPHIPTYPQPGSVQVNKQSPTTLVDFSNSGSATVQLSATAKPVEKGVDLIFIVDLSSSMRYYLKSSDYACGPKYKPNGNLNKDTIDQYIKPNKTDEENRKEYLEHVYNADWWPYTRMYAMEQSLTNMIQALSNSDVRIAISDFGDLDHYEFEDAVLDKSIRAWPWLDSSSDAGATGGGGNLEKEFSNHLNFVLSNKTNGDYHIDGTEEKGGSQPFWLHRSKYNTKADYYTGKVLPTIYTGSKDPGQNNLDSDAFVMASTLTQNNNAKLNRIIDKMEQVNGKMLGTNYDIGLETAYRLAYARQQANMAAGDDREIVCIFMSDGAAMQFNYFSGRSTMESWDQYLRGETDEILTNHDSSYYISSDYADHPEKQNPKLNKILQVMMNLLRSGNVFTSATDRTVTAYNGSSTDFFVAYQAVTGKVCTWDTFFKLFYYSAQYGAQKSTDIFNVFVNITGETGLTQSNLYGKLSHRTVFGSLRKPSSSDYMYQTLSPYYYFYNAEGKNWWAEALKGSSDQVYPVVDRFAKENSTETGRNFTYYGDVRNHYAPEGLYPEGSEPAWYGEEYISGYRGLDVNLFTIGFSLATEGKLAYSTVAQVLQNISSGANYHYEAADQAELDKALTSITSLMTSSATGAFYTDTMGEHFDLQLEENSTIKVMEFDIEDASNELGYTRKDDLPKNVKETITFKAGAESSTVSYEVIGTKVAYSDQVYTDHPETGVRTYKDIWDDEKNLITGKLVIYNANKLGDGGTDTALLPSGAVINGSIMVDLRDDPTVLDYTIAPETLFWKVGPIPETEIVMEYQVMLENAQDLPITETFYPTNTSAILSYNDTLHNMRSISTVSPEFPWQNKTYYRYALYLVDAEGMPSGGSFDRSQKWDSKASAPIVHGGSASILQTGSSAFDSIQPSSAYELYDPAIQVTVTPDYDAAQAHTLKSNSDKVYITTGTDTTNSTELITVTSNQKLTETVIYFPVRLKPVVKDDQVTIDFGLPVVIDVLANDEHFSSHVSITDVADTDSQSFGTMEIVDGKLKYTLTSMEMNVEDVYTFTITEKAASQRSFTGQVTIIPATSIYYEDSFGQIRYQQLKMADHTVVATVWNTTSGSETQDNQATDRPGSQAKDDANNIYGTDQAYENMANYSMGQARWVSVNKDIYATAEFTFTGTGFDIISMTDSTTGVITVGVYEGSNANGTRVKYQMIDTYYGYTYDDDTDQWVEAQGEAGLYQVPIIKVKDLEYGQYTVKITASYLSFMDHTAVKGSYDFYLDAIRIYDPANDGNGNFIIQGAYTEDQEGWPEYFELRNLILSKDSLDHTSNGQTVNGVVFIDGSSGENSLENYHNHGPKNELYLAPGQSISFNLKVGDASKVALGMKSVGGSVNLRIYSLENSSTIRTYALNTATDLYYDLTSLNNKTVVITNNGTSGTLSLTNVKVTYSTSHTDSLEKTYFAAAKVQDVLTDLNNKMGYNDNLSGSDNNVTMRYATVTLEDRVHMNFYFNYPGTVPTTSYNNIITATNMGLLIWYADPKDNAGYENAQAVVKGAILTDGANKTYMCNTPGIPAKKMGDNLYVRVYIEHAGTYTYGPVVSYSPKTYAYNVLNSGTGSEAMKDLCAALLNYGTAAQTHFGYRTDELMNTDLTRSIDPYDSTMGGTLSDVSNVSLKGYTQGSNYTHYASVSFDGSFAINYFLDLPADASNVKLYYWDAAAYQRSVANNQLATTTASGIVNIVNSAKLYKMQIAEIAAKELQDGYVMCAVYQIGSSTYCTKVVSYSVGAYCNTMAARDNVTMADLAKATAVYGHYAAKYFDSNS